MHAKVTTCAFIRLAAIRPGSLISWLQNAEAKPVAVVEVTTFNLAQDEIAQGQRDAAVYNVLDKAKLPAGWRIGLDIVKHGRFSAAWVVTSASAAWY